MSWPKRAFGASAGDRRETIRLCLALGTSALSPDAAARLRNTKLPLRVDFACSPSPHAMSAVCAFRPAGADVKQPFRMRREASPLGGSGPLHFDSRQLRGGPAANGKDRLTAASPTLRRSRAAPTDNQTHGVAVRGIGVPPDIGVTPICTGCHSGRAFPVASCWRYPVQIQS